MVLFQVKALRKMVLSNLRLSKNTILLMSQAPCKPLSSMIMC
jgi:hypothetical protein